VLVFYDTSISFHQIHDLLWQQQHSTRWRIFLSANGT